MMQTLFHSAEPGPTETDREIFAVLRELDSRLAAAIRISSLALSGTGMADPFRGLYVSQGQAECALQHAAGEPLYAAGQSPLTLAPKGSPLKRLQDTFSLSPFDLAVVVVALAPEIDLRYERVYSFLQNDVTRKRPLVDLALNLLCSSADERLIRRRHFAPTAPLLRHRILSLVADPSCSCPPLLAHALKLDEGIAQFLLGEPGLDGRIAHYCRLSAPGGLPAIALQGDLTSGMACLGGPLPESARPVVLLLRGKSRKQMLEAAQAAASEQLRTLLIADFSRRDENTNPLEQDVMLVLREAKLRRAIPYLDAIADVSQGLIAQALCELGGGVVAASSKTEMVFPPDLCRVITIDIPALDFAQRRACWKGELDRQEMETDNQTLDSLAGRFRFTPEQIERAVVEGRMRVPARTRLGKPELHSATKTSPAAALFAAARAQSGEKLTLMARKLCAKQTWSDLVLPEETVTQLREFCGRIVDHEQVLCAWGFDRKLSYGKGASALFAGPSGTGKTMAAEIIANEIQLDLYKIDLARVVSKFIGETEKNLDCIFTAAENANAILFFDEADVLFGKRSEVRDSHDRYANLEIGYLLQKMEAYEGAAILATNLSQNMDESFLRRFAFHVRFPFPDEAGRARIWKTIWPVETPRDAEIDFDAFGSSFKLSGGSIKNAALAAAFLAASNGGTVTQAHLLRGVEREYQKMGKFVQPEAMLATAEEVERK